MKKRLGDGLFLGLEVTLFNSRCTKMLALEVVKSELVFQHLLKWNRTRSPKNLEVYRHHVTKRLFIKEEHFPISIHSE